MLTPLEGRARSYLPPGEGADVHPWGARVLDATVERRLRHTEQEVDSREVPVGDPEHLLSQGLGAALVQSEVGHLQRDEARDDVQRHPDARDLRDPVGGVEDEHVVDLVGFCLHVLNVPRVDVLLGERRRRGLPGSHVALSGFLKAPQEAVRGRLPHCEHDLRWEVVLVSDLQCLGKARQLFSYMSQTQSATHTNIIIKENKILK